MGLRGKGPTLVGVLWTETFVCLVVLLLRLYTRTIIRNNIGYDDYLLIITWILMVAFAALCTASATYGMGVHVDELTTDEFSHGMFLLLVGQSVISLAMGISKCAVSAFLMRIMVQRWHLAFLWFWNISIMVLSILLCVSVFAQCTPVESIWDPRVKKEGCSLNLTIIATVMCSWAVVLDFVLAIFPWYALWNLNMKRKEKITICISLSLGVFAGVCGIFRTKSLNSLSQSADYLYATTDSVMWTNSEMTTSMICVSIPALRPLYRSIRGSGSSHDASNYNNLPPSGKSSRSRSRPSRPSYALDTLVTTTVQGKFDDGDASYNGDKTDAGDDTRRILPENTQPGIHQVQEITVSYEDRKGEIMAEGMPCAPVRARQHL